MISSNKYLKGSKNAHSKIPTINISENFDSVFRLNDDSDSEIDWSLDCANLENYVDHKLNIKQLNIVEDQSNFEFYKPHKKSMMKMVVNTLSQK